MLFYWTLKVITRATDHLHANSLITLKAPLSCGINWPGEVSLRLMVQTSFSFHLMIAVNYQSPPHHNLDTFKTVIWKDFICDDGIFNDKEIVSPRRTSCPALDDERMDDALRDLLYSICYTSGSQTVVQVPPVVRERSLVFNWINKSETYHCWTEL